jgi:hypothetical protein
MTSKDRRFGGIFFFEDIHRFKGTLIRVAMSLMRHVGNQAYGQLVKLGHACYVINGHNLSVFGTPSRSDCSQSAVGLP